MNYTLYIVRIPILSLIVENANHTKSLVVFLQAHFPNFPTYQFDRTS